MNDMVSKLRTWLIFSLFAVGFSACASDNIAEKPSDEIGSTVDESTVQERAEGSDFQNAESEPKRDQESANEDSDERVTESSSAEPSMSPEVEAAIVHCERVRAKPGNSTHLSLEDLATEGGYADVIEQGGEVVRLRGGLLFEVSRLRFDYVYRDGELLCAEETVSNVNVMSEPADGWDYFWSHQHLLFLDGRRVWENHAHTDGDRMRRQSPYDVGQFASSLLSRATAESGSEADPEQDDPGADRSSQTNPLREKCIERMAKGGGCCDPEEDPPPGAKPCFNGQRPSR